MNLKKIITVIKKNKSFLISTHTNPDPDALCSELVLALYLRSLKKKVIIVNEGKVPLRYRFLPGVQHIQVFNPHKHPHFQVGIIVDCGDLNRMGRVNQLFRGHKTIINIDHHVTNDRFGDYHLIDSQASSTAEVLYHLLLKSHFKLNKTVALLLYLGIMTDTGSFRYENTTSLTHKIVADLLQFKFSVAYLYRKLYENIPLYDIKAFIQAMEGMKVFQSGKIICVNLSKKDYAQFSQHFDLRDAIFKFLRAIQEVEVVMILSQVGKHKTRVNLRSTGKVDVAKLASFFGGGGHKRASGCLVDANILKTQKRLLQHLGKVRR